MDAGEFDFEIAFVTEPLVDPADERIDRATEALPDLVVSSGDGLTVITVLAPGPAAVAAGFTAAATIELSGIHVYRSYQDLVSRQDIADRADVTRQAVGNWVRGDRRSGASFPAPVSRVAGGAWLWGDVVAWLRGGGRSIDGDIEYPSLVDHNRIDLLLASRSLRSHVSQKWFGIEARVDIPVRDWPYGGSASGPRHAAQGQTMSVSTQEQAMSVSTHQLVSA